MGRTLGLICGAGPLPARMAEVARQQGWRVVAFVFAGADDLMGHADRVVQGRITEAGPILAAMQADAVSAALFSGRFSMPDVLRVEARTADETSLAIGERAGSRTDRRLFEAVTAVLAAVGIEVLDQRPFLGDLASSVGCLTRRAPTEAEWADIRRGLALARMIADAAIGQTVVVRHGAVAAAEAVEGTTEAIRRGAALAGPGAVIVKAVARDHDYRFDTPAIGMETVVAAAAGGASVIAVEAGRVLVVDRDATASAADAAGIALVGADDAG